MRIPYYVFGNFGIDAFFLDKTSAAEDRIYLITPTCEEDERDGLPPLPFDRVVSLLKEGYSNLHIERSPLNYKDILEGVYNPSSYMRRRQKEITLNMLSSMYISLYERLFELVNSSTYRLTWYKAEVKDGKIYICGKFSKSYTTLYSRDKKFKESFDFYLK